MNYKVKKNRIMALVLAGMLLTFPLRDAFGFTISGMPFRLAEILIIISAFFVSFFCSKTPILRQASQTGKNKRT